MDSRNTNSQINCNTSLVLIVALTYIAYSLPTRVTLLSAAEYVKRRHHYWSTGSFIFTSNVHIKCTIATQTQIFRISEYGSICTNYRTSSLTVLGLMNTKLTVSVPFCKGVLFYIRVYHYYQPTCRVSCSWIGGVQSSSHNLPPSYYRHTKRSIL